MACSRDERQTFSSAERRPGAVRIAARGSARGLGAAIDIYGMGEGTAVAAVMLIGRARDHCAVTARIRISPRHRRARLAALERVHLRGISALLVLVVHCSANAVTNQTTKQAADHGAAQPVAWTGDRGTDQRPGSGP